MFEPTRTFRGSVPPGEVTPPTNCMLILQAFCYGKCPRSFACTHRITTQSMRYRESQFHIHLICEWEVGKKGLLILNSVTGSVHVKYKKSSQACTIPEGSAWNNFSFYLLYTGRYTEFLNLLSSLFWFRSFATFTINKVQRTYSIVILQMSLWYRGHHTLWGTTFIPCNHPMQRMTDCTTVTLLCNKIARYQV